MKSIATLLLSFVVSLTAFQTLASKTLDSHEHGSANLSIAIDNNLISIRFESPAVNIVGFEYQPNDEEQQARVTEAENMLSNFEATFNLKGEPNCRVLQSSANWISDHDEHSEHENDISKTDHADHSEHDNETAKSDHDSHSEHENDTTESEHDGHSEHENDTAGSEHESHSEHENNTAESEHDGHSEHENNTAESEHDGHSEHENNVVKAEHAEFLAQFELQCEQINNLAAIDVKILTLFPAIDEIDAQIIYPGGQLQQELTIDNTLINLSN
ncbi:MAG: hypothetical protein ACI9YO_000595 [Gammaproteobacteria bacterium]|jgi:hypothetical protein